MANGGDQEAGRSGDAAEPADGTNRADGAFSELKETAKEAVLGVLKPAVKTAAAAAATYAVKKGPELIKDKVEPKLAESGGLGGLANQALSNSGGLGGLANQALSNAGPVGKVASKLGMGGKLVDSVMGGDDEADDGEAEADATGSGRRMPVQQSMDVAVPLEVAYNEWTQFEEYPNFMHRVDSASQEDDAHVTFTEKIWGFSRDFEAEIIEQRPNERIVWRSVNGLKHAGVVTFHELAPRLTRIEVTVDFKPESLFQKFARGARYSKRAIRGDMHRFKAYVEMNEEEDGAWRGRIEEGEVVAYEDEGEEAEGADAEAGADEELPEDEVEELPEDEVEEIPEDEVEEPEEEEAPARGRSRSQSSGNGRQGSSQGRRGGGQGRQRTGGNRRSPERPRSPQRPRSAAR
jgi:uncharacterized membrane protein